MADGLIKSEYRCISCVFYRPGGDRDQGFCVRHAPIAIEVMAQTIGPRGVQSQKQIQSVFPPIRSDAWCGDHRPKANNGTGQD